MRGLVLTIAVVASGCVAHGGAFVGIRSSGKVSYGWQAGAGTLLEGVVGQSCVRGRAFTYAAAHGWMPVVAREGSDAGGLRQADIGLMLGAGGSGHGADLAFGLDSTAFAGARDDMDHSVFTGAALTAGIRIVDGEGEAYVGAELRHVDYSVFDGGD